MWLTRSSYTSSISSQEFPNSDRQTWQTVLTGDLYELRPDEVEEKPNASKAKRNGLEASATMSNDTSQDVKPVRSVAQGLDVARSLPSPPIGYHFHKLNPDDTEVTCDAFGESMTICLNPDQRNVDADSNRSDIAGRLYSGLDISAWGAQIRSGESKHDPNGTSSTDRVLSLAGKAAGKKATVPATTWVGKLTVSFEF
jgi:hypothetical protein